MNKRKQAPTEAETEQRGYKKPKKQIILSKHKRKWSDIGSDSWAVILSFLDIKSHLAGASRVCKRFQDYARRPLSWPAKITIPNCCWFPLTTDSKTMFSSHTRELCISSQVKRHEHLVQPPKTPFLHGHGDSNALAQVVSLCSNLETLEVRDTGMCVTRAKVDIPPNLARDILRHMHNKHLPRLRVFLDNNRSGLTQTLLDLDNRVTVKVDHLSVVSSSELAFQQYRYIACIVDFEAKRVDLRGLLIMTYSLPQTVEDLRLSKSIFLGGVFGPVPMSNASCQLRRFEMDDTTIVHFARAMMFVVRHCPLLEEIVATRQSWDIYSTANVVGLDNLPTSKAFKKLTIESCVSLMVTQTHLLHPAGISLDAAAAFEYLGEVCVQHKVEKWKLMLSTRDGQHQRVWTNGNAS